MPFSRRLSPLSYAVNHFTSLYQRVCFSEGRTVQELKRKHALPLSESAVWEDISRHTVSCGSGHKPVEPGWSLQMCARLRAVLVVPVCLAVFTVVLFPSQGRQQWVVSPHTDKHSRQVQASTCKSSHTSCSDSVPDNFLSLPLAPAPPFLRPDPGFRPLRKKKDNRVRKCDNRSYFKVSKECLRDNTWNRTYTWATVDEGTRNQLFNLVHKNVLNEKHSS